MKKFFSFVIVMAAAAMISCSGNANNNAANEVEAEVTETVCEGCEQVDSTCCCEKADSACCEKADSCCGKCAEKAE